MNTNLVHDANMNHGQIIASLREQRGWKRPRLAEAMGTSAQQIERLEKGQRRLTTEWLQKAADAFGVPLNEMLDAERALAAIQPDAPPPVNAERFTLAPVSSARMQESLPIFGGALGSSRLFDGEAIEQTMLNSGETVGFLKRPRMLEERTDVYGLYVHGSSMEPVYSPGAVLVAETGRPPRIGDDVVVYLRCDGDEDDGQRARAVLVKRLVKRGADWIELEQFTPPATFRLTSSDYIRVDRVMTLGDLLG